MLPPHHAGHCGGHLNGYAGCSIPYFASHATGRTHHLGRSPQRRQQLWLEPTVELLGLVIVCGKRRGVNICQSIGRTNGYRSVQDVRRNEKAKNPGAGCKCILRHCAVMPPLWPLSEALKRLNRGRNTLASRWLIDRPLHQFSICGSTAESWAVLCCWSLIKGSKPNAIAGQSMWWSMALFSDATRYLKLRVNSWYCLHYRRRDYDRTCTGRYQSLNSFSSPYP